MSLLIKENLISLLSAYVFFFTKYLPLICNNDSSLLTVLATNNRIANNVIANNVIACNVDA